MTRAALAASQSAMLVVRPDLVPPTCWLGIRPEIRQMTLAPNSRFPFIDRWKRRAAAGVIPPSLFRIACWIEADGRLVSAESKISYLRALTVFELYRFGVEYPENTRYQDTLKFTAKDERYPFSRIVIERYVAELASAGVKNTSVAHTLYALRWLAKRYLQAVDDGDVEASLEIAMTEEEMRTLSMSLQGILSLPVPKPGRDDSPMTGPEEQEDSGIINVSDFMALIRACQRDTTPAGARDAAIFYVEWRTGLRSQELTTLELAALKRAPGEFELAVLGKGRKRRQVFIFSQAAEALGTWLDARGPGGRYVFCPVSKSGKVQADHRKPMATQTIRRIKASRLEQAGITRPIRMHDFRRTFVSRSLSAGTDISLVATQVGHESLTTTRRYDRRGKQHARQAFERYEPENAPPAEPDK